MLRTSLTYDVRQGHFRVSSIFHCLGTSHPNQSCSVTVAPECIEAFNKLKLGKTTKWIIYKLSDNQKEIVVEEQGADDDWSVFREKLVNAKSADGKQGARYAVYDVSYEAEGGAGSRNKITFIAWVPDGAGIKVSRL